MPKPLPLKAFHMLLDACGESKFVEKCMMVTRLVANTPIRRVGCAAVRVDGQGEAMQGQAGFKQLEKASSMYSASRNLSNRLPHQCIAGINKKHGASPNPDTLPFGIRMLHYVERRRRWNAPPKWNVDIWLNLSFMYLH